MSIVEAGLGEALPLAPSTGPLLLADQEVGSRTMLRNALATRGFEVVAVASGRQVVSLRLNALAVRLVIIAVCVCVNCTNYIAPE